MLCTMEFKLERLAIHVHVAGVWLDNYCNFQAYDWKGKRKVKERNRRSFARTGQIRLANYDY